jgi:hypothetical protein
MLLPKHFPTLGDWWWGKSEPLNQCSLQKSYLVFYKLFLTSHVHHCQRCKFYLGVQLLMLCWLQMFCIGCQGGIPVGCHFVLCSSNFDVKICTKKVKLYYKWDKSGIPLDTLSSVSVLFVLLLPVHKQSDLLKVVPPHDHYLFPWLGHIPKQKKKGPFSSPRTLYGNKPAVNLAQLLILVVLCLDGHSCQW